MKRHQIAAQLYSIRDFIQTPQDIATSMKKIRAIGYQAVQVSGMGTIEESELMRILDGEGLTCCATHEATKLIVEEPQRVVERLHRLNCKYSAVPSPGQFELKTREQVIEYSKRMDDAGKVLYEAGQVLTYHNHHMEFRRLEGELILDTVYAQTDVRYLQGEIDTYWVQYGGGDVVGWCEKLKGRLPLIHLKDYQITDDNKPDFAEVGQGNLNWSEIIPAAEKSGCEWFIVEQDTTPGDPFDSLKISFDYLAALAQ
jgi:sugar phosphate isomerase/epimerase